MVVERIGQRANTPVILTGDFNVDQNDEIYRIFTQSGLVDSYAATHQRFAENGTFNAFRQDRKTASRIDHILVSPQFSVERYGVLTNTYWSDRQRLPSDHYPVFVRLERPLPTNVDLPLNRGSLRGSVNPVIGTGGHGHVFLGANVPFGFVQLGPTNRKDGWDWCSGYHYSDSIIIGFSHLHLSGTGCADLGNMEEINEEENHLAAHGPHRAQQAGFSLFVSRPLGSSKGRSPWSVRKGCPEGEPQSKVVPLRARFW